MNIVFLGTPAIAAYILQKLISANHNIIACYTQPDKKQGRGQKIKYSPVKEIALSNNITVLQPENITTNITIDTLHKLKPDLLLVVAYGKILTTNFLQTAKFGGINIHMSLLPRWRGATPIERAILNGDQVTGVTIMQMDAGLDTGNILLQQSCPIDNNDTTLTLTEKLKILGANAILQVLSNLPYYLQNSTPQQQKDATYAKKLQKEDGHINWHNNALQIIRQIHAFNPWPGSYSVLHKEKLYIWEAQIINYEYSCPPGTICIHNNSILVAAQDNFVQIITLQFPGKCRLSAKDILNAKRELLQYNQLL